MQFGKHGMNKHDLCQKGDTCSALEHSAKRNLAGQRLACGVHACTAVKGLQIRLTQRLWKKNRKSYTVINVKVSLRQEVHQHATVALQSYTASQSLGDVVERR